MNIENYPLSDKANSAYAYYLQAVKDTTNTIVQNKKSPTIKTAVVTEQKLKTISNQEAFTLSEKDLSQYISLYSIEKYNIV